MEATVAIIGGTGLYDADLLEDPQAVAVGTPYGVVPLQIGGSAGQAVAFVARHGDGHSVPPHRINYRANIWALHELGVRRILATAACGAIGRSFRPGTLHLLQQFLDFTSGRAGTFFDGEDGHVQHVDMTRPYCPEMAEVCLRAAAELGLPLGPGATYVCTQGPRFETPAEITAYDRLGGELVGMTGVPEVVLAREVGICYASIAIATNFAAGRAAAPLSHAEVVAAMASATADVRRLLRATIAALADAGPCQSCAPPPSPV